MFVSIDFMKAIACLLIVNFHCLYIYPESLSWLSFGGDLGNNIFFLVSGFTLLPSIEKTNIRNIGSWLKKRYIRIVPISFVFNLISFMIYPKSMLPGGMFKCFIFPMVYWFVGALLIFYPILFCVEKINNKGLVYLLIVLMLFMHLTFDSLYTERYIMGLAAMIVGAELRKNLSVQDVQELCGYSKKYIITTGILFVIFVFSKLIYRNNIGPQRLEHLIIGTLSILIASCLLLALFYQEKKLRNLKLINVVKILSRLTLSSYLCQQLINVIVVDFFKNFRFPISIILYLIFIYCVSYVVERIDFYVRKSII